jgi:hypothetical protein
MAAVSDEHGEIFHRSIPSEYFTNSKALQWKWSLDVLANCCWSLLRETPIGENKRQKKTK